MVYRQLVGGSVEWTSPTGHTYTTTPGAGFFFPVLAASTGELVLPNIIQAPGENRGLMMPARRQTRAAERAAHIASERRINETRMAEENETRGLAGRHLRTTTVLG